MAEYYCFSDAAGGGNGTLATPWNSLSTALTALQSLYSGAGAAAGVNLNLRGQFIGGFSVSNLSGTSGSKFQIRTDPGAPSKAIIDGDYTYPTQQGQITINWYRTGSSTGPLAGSGWGGYWYGGILRFISCDHMAVTNVVVRNSLSQGISGISNGVLDGVEFYRCWNYGLAAPSGSAFTMRNCWMEDCSIINYRGAMSVVYPIIGGLVCGGQNGATAKTSTTITTVQNRLIEDCTFLRSGGEQINSFSTVGTIVRRCTFINPMTVSLYVHNSTNALIENCIFINDPTLPGSWFVFDSFVVLPASELVFPGFPSSKITWTSNPPSGAFAIADPHLTGAPRHIGAGLGIGSEYTQIIAGSDITIRGNVFYGTGLREYWTNGSGFTVPWSATNKAQTNLRVEYNTFVSGPRNAGIELQATFSHDNMLFRNNVFDQLPSNVAQAMPSYSAQGITSQGNVYRLNPGTANLTAADYVGDPRLTKGTGPVSSRAWFMPLAGSAAIQAAVPISGVTTDALGVTRDATHPTSGALEYVANVVDPDISGSERISSRYWSVYCEFGTATTDGGAVREIEFAESIGGQTMTASKTVSGANVTNASNAFDSNTATSATAAQACTFLASFTAAQELGEVRIRYPASVVVGSAGPTRVVVTVTHPVTGWQIPIAEVNNVVPTADKVLSVPVNVRMGQVRGLRGRGLTAVIAARG